MGHETGILEFETKGAMHRKGVGLAIAKGGLLSRALMEAPKEWVCAQATLGNSVHLGLGAISLQWHQTNYTFAYQI